MYITKEDFPIDIEHQSIEVPDSGGARQSTLAPPGETFESAYEGTETLIDVFQRGLEKSKNGPCLGWRGSNSDYEWLSYGEVIERSKNISHGLIQAGMKKGQESHIILYSRNCVEYVLVEKACFLQSAVPVPLYDVLGTTACTYIINHVEAEFLACDTSEKAKSIIDNKDNTPKLQKIVVFEEVKEDLKTLASAKGVTIYQLKDIEESGKNNPESFMLPSPTDLAIICFTSGTTGNPKGVMLSHRNMVSSVSAFCRNLGLDYIGSDDVYLSYLPMAHVFDRMGQLLLYVNGGSVGFFSGDIKLLLEDLTALKPTIIPAVPRVLNKIYDKVQSMVETNKIKKILLKMALRAKEVEMERGIIRNTSLWDRLVLKNVRNIFGGRLRLMATGGAPIRKEVLMFFKCCLGCAVVEAYGQTETTGASNCTVMGDTKLGTVGPPISSVFMKLADVPEMGYYARNGEGEILAKGPSVTTGYYNDPERTAEVLDDDGWLKTGDIGRWEENGTLAVIDRKKNIMKLSQGEYISPERIESVYLTSSYIEQIFVYGDSLESFLVAIVSPVKDSLTSWCSQEGIGGEWNDICKNEVVKTHLLKEMNDLGKKAGLKGFEQAKSVYLYPDGFTIENGILTATMKVKREECLRRFKDVIQKMYQEKRGRK